MGEMRDRMEKELKLRGYSPRTLKTYVRAVHNFVQYSRRPAEQMGAGEARSYVLHLIEETAHHAGHAESTREMLDGTTSDW